MNRLPNELLGLIFQNLDYWDLRLRVPLVCRRFYEYLAKRQSNAAGTLIDRLLFRDSVSPTTKLGALPLTEYKLHPIFLQGIEEGSSCLTDHMTSKEKEESVQDARFFISHLYNRRFDYGRDSEIPPFNENFVSPAVDKISFIYDSDAYQDYPTIDNQGKPITVGEVADALTKDFMFGLTDSRRVVAWWISEIDEDVEHAKAGKFGSDAVLGLLDIKRNNCDLFYLELGDIVDGFLRFKYMMPEKRKHKGSSEET